MFFLPTKGSPNLLDKSKTDEPVAMTFIPSIESTINFKINPISGIFCDSSDVFVDIKVGSYVEDNILKKVSIRNI